MTQRLHIDHVGAEDTTSGWQKNPEGSSGSRSSQILQAPGITSRGENDGWPDHCPVALQVVMSLLLKNVPSGLGRSLSPSLERLRIRQGHRCKVKVGSP